jgi:hypothetical protein
MLYVLWNHQIVSFSSYHEGLLDLLLLPFTKVLLGVLPIATGLWLESKDLYQV